MLQSQCFSLRFASLDQILLFKISEKRKIKVNNKLHYIRLKIVVNTDSSISGQILLLLRLKVSYQLPLAMVDAFGKQTPVAYRKALA